MKNNGKLTSANIRYLLTMKAFSDADKPIRITYLADYFHYKKSSIHAMIQHLIAAGLVSRNEDNTISLTEKGADTAVRYQMYYCTVDTMMQTCFPTLENRENVVLALLSEIPEQTLQGLKAAD